MTLVKKKAIENTKNVKKTESDKIGENVKNYENGKYLRTNLI